MATNSGKRNDITKTDKNWRRFVDDGTADEAGTFELINGKWVKTSKTGPSAATIAGWSKMPNHSTNKSTASGKSTSTKASTSKKK